MQIITFRIIFSGTWMEEGLGRSEVFQRCENSLSDALPDLAIVGRGRFYMLLTATAEGEAPALQALHAWLDKLFPDRPADAIELMVTHVGPAPEAKPAAPAPKAAPAAPAAKPAAPAAKTAPKADKAADLKDFLSTVDRSLVGAQEFKDLLHEVSRMAPQVVAHKSQAAFCSRSYLFVCNQGDGLTTSLKLFRDLLIKCGLVTQNTHLPALEIALDYPLKENPGWIRNCDTSESPLLCVDISQWTGHTNSPEFKQWLLRFTRSMEKRVVVFRIPYVEQKVLGDITEALRDVLFLRPVVFVPPSMEQLVTICKNFLGDRGFEIDPICDTLLEQRIRAEKADGRFYGVNTLNKLVNELICLKLYHNCLNGEDDSLIQAHQVKDFMATATVDDETSADMLDRLYGVESVRAQLESVVNQIAYARSNHVTPPCIHMRFVGNPGTGKTTIARILGKMLKERGVLRHGGFVEAHGRDLCGEYVGHTAPKTQSIVRDALGSVLFIDEAYSLYQGDPSSRDYGREAIDTLIACMENYRDDLVVIFAGYPEEMDRLLETNKGLRDRMPYTINFPNYTREQLCHIFLSLAGSFPCSEDFAPAAEEFFAALPDSTLNDKTFSNARFVRNLYERTWGKALDRSRLAGQEPTLTPEDLTNAGRELSVAPIARRPSLGFVW